LIEVLDKTDNPLFIYDVQLALANAANQVIDPEKRIFNNS